ncbi:hypothetical protein CDAR_539031 [Caerostris darwini]|uniref:Uncharacterized protein n=1 Tax=Caerostris darwini TaxID=1538125 RepID=A0AAV4T2S3_9ARAC|nr:hypothetical protein CDAR_539031 [Caerostris darwini]
MARTDSLNAPRQKLRAAGLRGSRLETREPIIHGGCSCPPWITRDPLSFAEMFEGRITQAGASERALWVDKSITVANTKSLRSPHTQRRHPIEMDPDRCVRPQDSMFALGFWAAHAKRAEIETLPPRMMNRLSLGCNRNKCKEASANDVSIPLRGVVLRNVFGRQGCVKCGSVRRIWEAQTCWIPF